MQLTVTVQMLESFQITSHFSLSKKKKKNPNKLGSGKIIFYDSRLLKNRVEALGIFKMVIFSLLLWEAEGDFLWSTVWEPISFLEEKFVKEWDPPVTGPPSSFNWKTHSHTKSLALHQLQGKFSYTNTGLALTAGFTQVNWISVSPCLSNFKDTILLSTSIFLWV